MTLNAEIIEDDIIRIRKRMEQRLDQLNHDVQPAQLMQGLLNGNGSSVNTNVTNLLETAKANPIAATVVGLGIASLFMSKQTKSTEPASVSATTDTASRVGDHLSNIQSSSAEVSTTLKSGLNNAQATAESIGTKAKRKLETAATAANETLQDAVEATSETARSAPAQLKARADDATHWVKQNPIPAGLMAIAAGAAVSSFFTAKGSASRLEASKQLHADARTSLPKPAAKKKTKPKAKTASKKSSNKKLPPKPITTRVAKARNAKGKPDTAAKAAVAPSTLTSA